MSNNIVVKSTLPRTASTEEKLNEITNQLQQKYQGETIYYLWEIKKQNKEVNFETLAKWIKKVTGLSLIEYLVANNILTPVQYFESAVKDISVEDIKGKKCCAFNADGTICTALQDSISKCGAIIVSPDANDIDYVFGLGSQKISKIPQDRCGELFSLFDKRDKGELNFEVVARGFVYKLEAYMDACTMTQEERNNLDVFTYNQPQEIFHDYGYVFKNSIKNKEIPQYDPEKHYWSLAYFYEWFGLSGGEIRGSLDFYYVEESEDPTEGIKRTFKNFSDLCERIEEKKIQSYLSQKIKRSEDPSKKNIVVASLGYIDDFDGCWCVVLTPKKDNVVSIELKKIKLLKHIDDLDYVLTRLDINGIPATLCAIIEGKPDDYPFRNMDGYLWIDSPSGVIPKRAFANDSNIRYVEISDYVNRIDFNAFANCMNLESIKFGRAVEEINAGAFSNCGKLKTVIIPSAVKTIGPRCFKDCTNLSEVSFESESCCEIIETSAFAGCSSLNAITIPQSVKTIVEEAFRDCTSLVKVCFDEQSVCTAIRSRAFSGCVSLSVINIPESAVLFENVFEKCDQLKAMLLSQKKENLLCSRNYDNKLEASVFKKTLTEAEYRKMFDYHWSGNGVAIFKLKTKESVVEIPSTIGRYPVVTIAQSAFADSEITEITIPETVTDISKHAFANCKKLKRVYLRASIREIKNWFDSCTDLEELFISKTVKKFAYDALCGCAKLSNISVDPKNKDISVIDHVLYSDNGKTLLRCPPGRLESVFQVSAGVTKIEKEAFRGCINLTSIILSNSVTTICDGAFEGCVNLTNISIPESVTKMGWSIFSGCTRLTVLKIPSSVEYINAMTFSRCENLKDIIYMGTREQWNSVCSSALHDTAKLAYSIHCSDDNDAG